MMAKARPTTFGVVCLGVLLLGLYCGMHKAMRDWFYLPGYFR